MFTKKSIILGALFLLFFFTVSMAACDQNKNLSIKFEDENLEELVRVKINKPDGDLYLSDVKGIEELDAAGKNIESIEGIQYLENLADLDLGPLTFPPFYENEITDISPISELTNLKFLDISNNEVSDISVLENLTELKHLYFNNNRVSDISILENLTKLEILCFWDNEVENIDAIENLTELKTLMFFDNEVKNIDAIENLTELQWVYLSGNKVEDITPLVNNDGLGKDDKINLAENYLDLTEGSNDRQNINKLKNRGVRVELEQTLSEPMYR